MRATIPDRTYGGAVPVQIPKIPVHRLLVVPVPVISVLVPRGTDTSTQWYSDVSRLLRPTYDTRRAAPCSNTCMDALRTHYGTGTGLASERPYHYSAKALHVVDVQRKLSFKNSVTLFNTTSPSRKRRSEAGTNVLKRITQPGLGYNGARLSPRTIHHARRYSQSSRRNHRHDIRNRRQHQR